MKSRVENCLSLDAFSLAKKVKAEPGPRVLRKVLSEKEHLSVYLDRRPEGWLTWGAVIPTSVDDNELWPAMRTAVADATENPQTALPEVLQACKAWEKARPVSFPFATVYAPQLVQINTTTSPIGTRCEWFLCPKVQDGQTCDSRRRKLYWRDGQLACRACHDLRYMTQTLGRSDRLFLRAENIRWQVLSKLPAHEAADWINTPLMFPPPPPQMTFKRYEELAEEWERCRKVATGLDLQKMHREADEMLRRLGVS